MLIQGRTLKLSEEKVQETVLESSLQPQVLAGIPEQELLELSVPKFQHVPPPQEQL